MSLALLLAVASCTAPKGAEPKGAEPSGGGGASASSQSPTTEPGGPADLAVTIDGEDVRPSGKQLSVTAGEPLTVTVSSDRAGSLHFHSKPEQFVDFTSGETRTTVTFKVPGLVEVEDHDTSDVVAQVEVRG